jgi:hypothetical protein
MKNLIILTLCVIAIFSTVACKKETPKLPPTIVQGKVTEYGTDKTLEGAKVILVEGTTSGSSGTYSFYPLDTMFTDKNGEYFYEHKLSTSSKAYALWFFKDNYEPFQKQWVRENETLTSNIKLFPFAWLKIRVINDKPFGPGDILSIKVTDQDRDFQGNKVNQDFIEKVKGNTKQSFSWIIQRNLKWGQVFVESVYCMGHDTTYYELKY